MFEGGGNRQFLRLKKLIKEKTFFIRDQGVKFYIDFLNGRCPNLEILG